MERERRRERNRIGKRLGDMSSTEQFRVMTQQVIYRVTRGP